MSKTEKGIQKNLGNFESLISNCGSYEEKYNPGNPDLSLTSLEAFLEKITGLVETEIQAKKVFQNHINHRVAVFDGIGQFSGRIINALISGGASQAKLDDAAEHHRKLNGRRATSIDGEKEKQQEENPGEEGSTRHSVSQLGFDNKISHFRKLIATIKTETTYVPNEEDLTLVALEQKLEAMETANKKLKNAKSIWNHSIIERNDGFSNEKTGMVQVVKLVKGYVKSVFLTRSPQYRQISGLQFTKIK